ncbi:DUF6412 domain-containing protein [Prescottella defluvii]|uniref:DUF6412 domain-containing protein n=1 Tax=Prescottella defluvii TaxID=1323361 RepID=UPI0012E03F62|nr:DUF6412 domain-containing protein [Prescottella defluvii]
MGYGWRRSTDVLVFLLLWAAISLLALGIASTGDTTSLLAGLVVAVAAVAALVLVWRADDLIFGLGRTTRGPTGEEKRLRGAFRRHSHPDAPGRRRPRAPGLLAGATPTA